MHKHNVRICMCNNYNYMYMYVQCIFYATDADNNTLYIYTYSSHDLQLISKLYGAYFWYMSSKMSLKRPSYFFRIVFLVLYNTRE